MQIGKGFMAGVIAAGVMTLVMGFFRWAGMPVALELLLGTLVTPRVSNAWLAGFLIHLGLGGAFGILYGAVFEYIAGGASWSVGVAVGAVHALASGALLALVPRLHPLIPERMPAPGAYMTSLGALGVLAFVLVHLVFGAIVGEIYRPVKLHHRREAPV